MRHLPGVRQFVNEHLARLQVGRSEGISTQVRIMSSLAHIHNNVAIDIRDGELAPGGGIRRVGHVDIVEGQFVAENQGSQGSFGIPQGAMSKGGVAHQRASNKSWNDGLGPDQEARFRPR